jgi:hypothetical protein
MTRLLLALWITATLAAIVAAGVHAAGGPAPW